MRYVAAYLLLNLGGKANPSEADIKSLLNAVGVGIDDDKLKFVLSQLKDKDINEVLAEGAKKLASVPAGGAAPAAGGTAGGAAAGGAADAAEEKKEESEEEESDDDMGFSLFD